MIRQQSSKRVEAAAPRAGERCTERVRGHLRALPTAHHHEGGITVSVLTCGVTVDIVGKGEGGFPGGPVVQNLLCNEGDLDPIPGRGAKIPRATPEPV